jgi:hypothetical protein
MKLRIFEAAEGTIEYYVEEYLPALSNKDLIHELELITLQNNGQRGEYNDMISAIKQELLSRMK